MHIDVGQNQRALRAWVVLATHPHRERTALENLERQQFTTYCPLIRKRHSHARRVSEVLRPLFPGYVFVQLAPAQRWRPLNSTIGVRSIIRSGDTISLLDDKFVCGLKAREVDGVISRPAVPYKIGQTVRLAAAGFDRVLATIIDLGERDRITVLLNLLNRPVRAEVTQSQIAAV